MAKANGDNVEGSPAPWSGSSTPPEVYGAFARPGFDSGLLDGLESERTIEDSSPPRRNAAARTVPDLEESGDYDVSALAPLRHLLDQDWTDPNVRSRLKSREPQERASDPSLSPTASAANVAPPRRTWDYDFGENPADVETVVVPVVTDQQAAATPPPAPHASPLPRPEAPLEPLPEPPVSTQAPPVVEAQVPVAVRFEDAASSEPPAPAPAAAERKGRRKALPWLLAAGVVAIGAAMVVPQSAFAPPAAPQAPVKFVLGSEPEAEVFQGETLLGTTPLLLEPSQVGDGLRLRKAGFEDETFKLEIAPSQDLIAKYRVVLDPAAVPLDWTGLPGESKLVWQGQAATPRGLTSVMPGTYSLKVSSAGRPSVTVPVTVLAPGGPESGTAVKVGAMVRQALEKQPALSMTFKSGKGKAPKLPLAVTVEQTAGGQFKGATRLEGKAASQLVLPGPGTYQVKVAATSTHKAFSQTVTVKDADRKAMELALTPLPPKLKPKAPAVAAPPSGGGGGGGYTPPPYYPPPVYSGGGGGGGGGGGASIAPPSF